MKMTQKFIRTRNTWAAYLLLAFYAYFLNIPGPITPFLRDEFELSYTASSLHFSAFAAGILVVGLLGQVVIQRIGRWLALVVGAFGLSLGALLLVLGRSPAMTIGGIFLMGCVGSLILAVVPAALSDEHGELRSVALSEANLLASLIAAAAPLLVGWFARLVIGWRLALVLAILPTLLIGVLLFRLGRVPQMQAGNLRSGGRLPFRFWFYWVTLILAVSIEFCMIYWSADYLVKTFQLSTAAAAQAISLFLGGMILGRALTSRLLRCFSARQIIFASILLGMSGFLLYWNTASVLPGLIGLALTGLGIASLYPLILSLAIGASGGNESRAGARATLASGVAILCLPLLLGRLADVAGLKPAFAVVAALFIVILLMMLIARRVDRAVPAADRQSETA
jgi:fucose permease